MNQQTLWNGDGQIAVNTRVAAALSIAPLKSSMLLRVLAFVTARGEHGATDEEIQLGVALRESTARARRVELRDGGQVRDSGRRRKTRSERDATVWVATGQPLEGPGR